MSGSSGLQTVANELKESQGMYKNHDDVSFMYEHGGMELYIFAKIKKDGYEPNGSPYYYVESLDVMHKDIELDPDDMWVRKTTTLREGGVKFVCLTAILEQMALEERWEGY